MTSRLLKIGDALSQLVNVAFLPMHHQTSANESISGRAHRCGWIRAEAFIDWIFSPWETHHCRIAYERDIDRAKAAIESRNLE